MHLLPPSIARAYAVGDTDEMKRLGTMTCMECGCCSYSCPAHRPIVQVVRMAKDAVRAASAKSTAPSSVKK